MNNFASVTQRFFSAFIFVFITIILISVGIKTSKGDISYLVLIIAISAALLIVLSIIKNPPSSIFYTLIISHTLGIDRYLPVEIPIGLAVDAFLFIGVVAIFITRWKKAPWPRAFKYPGVLMLIWFGFVLLEIGNPENQSLVAWFYAMRSHCLYPLLTILIVCLSMTEIKYLEKYFIFWGIFSFLASLKGLQQQFFGPDHWEQAWLDGGGHITHILFGKLRVFSFMSDAGVFGAWQAQTMLVFGIVFIGTGNIRKKFFFGTVAILAFIGMMISGTRGALAVPAIGGLTFLLLKKNFKVLSLGVSAMILVFVFLKFTDIGNNNYQIRRMRTALDPNDASFQVRLHNQQLLKSYLATRPIGAGIGSSGSWGLRFSPWTFISQIPTDSWYVMIWADTGFIGLTLHFFILFYLLIMSGRKIWYNIRDPELNQLFVAVLSGFAGIMMASYANGLLGQHPISMLLYISWGFFALTEYYDDELNKKKSKGELKNGLIFSKPINQKKNLKSRTKKSDAEK